MFNGEIYDAFDYKAGLERDGFTFRSRTDTEVMFELYEQDGLDGCSNASTACLRSCWPTRATEPCTCSAITTASSRWYWAKRGSTVVFASEAKAFLAHPAFRAEIDPEQVDELLAFRYVAGEASLLKGVRHVQPGHRLTITPGRVTEMRSDHPGPPR